MSIKIIQADLSNPEQGQAIVNLLNSYATDIMGGGQPLPKAVRENLISSLQQRSDAVILLALVDGQPAGLMNCFEGFSTFKCKPLMNIHDVAVLPEFRGLGLSQKMLSKIESISRERGCCKLTLEVLEGNKVAQQAYMKYGFAAYELDPSAGRALFWEMALE